MTPPVWLRNSRQSGATPNIVFRDPANKGRQIRIMPGYPPGSRPDPVTWGPYAVVSQNGLPPVKIPLAGNPFVMTNEETVRQLVQEIHDLLDVSTVGLYEFLWQLNTPDQTLSIEQRRQVARQALDILLAEGDLTIVELRWPESKPLRELSFNQLSESAWNDPGDDGHYVGLGRTEAANPSF